MAVSSKYQARQPDADGFILYAKEEHAVWHDLMEAQLALFPGRMCQQFMAGLALLDLPRDRIPQLCELNEKLFPVTGWQVEAVPALINFEKFFKLLSEKKFPVATFIRRREEIEYLQEPDIFHEVLGHIPLLTQPMFAEFTHRIGKLGVALSSDYHVWLARIYWMTIEFGLVKTKDGLRAYGAGIASSKKEIIHSLAQAAEFYQDFEPVAALRTAYRIDKLQPTYFVLESFADLMSLNDEELVNYIDEARALGVIKMH